ncbi:MAG: anthranilate phosphoribosyltransferase [Planctomycetota bacterium]
MAIDDRQLSDAIAHVRKGMDLSTDRAASLIDLILQGSVSDDLIGQLLLALRDKGESVSELVGAAMAMRSHMTRIEHHHETLLDTCGTGGSGSGTFNISTAVAIVTAACGVAVAKHGNRKATSHSGSADVLECLGVPITAEADQVSDRLNSIGICFCFAAKLHPAMKHVVAIRRQLKVPTLFNMLGPLCNPAGATHQLLGTASHEAQAKIAAAVKELGTRRSYIIHASDGQDEVSLDGETICFDVTPDGTQTLSWRPADFGLLPASVDALQVADPTESAKLIEDLLAGRPGPPRDVVIAGTAAALQLVGESDRLASGSTQAAAAIDSGKAAEKLSQLRAS